MGSRSKPQSKQGLKSRRKMSTTITASTSSDLTGIEGLKAYDQETFENDVSKQLEVYVEKQKREHELKRVQIEYESVKANYAKAVLNLRKAEDSIKETVSRGVNVSDRKIQALLNEQEKQKNELQSEIENLETDVSKEECNEDNEIAETANERQIRLGQMTAFGTLLVSKTNRVDENRSSKQWMDHDDESDNDEKKKKQIRKRKLEQQMPSHKKKKKDAVERYDDS